MQTTAESKPFAALYDWYRRMRADQPVFRDPESQVWHLFRYADVTCVLSDYETFSSATVRRNSDAHEHAPLSSVISSTMIQMDPPDHRQLRGLVSQAFTPRTVEQLSPRIGAITNELLDQVTSQGAMEVVRELATPLPVTVIAELLGIPVLLHEDFKRWSDAVLASHEEATEEEKQALFQDIERMFHTFTQMLEARREQPQHDLMSALLSASVDGHLLSDQELLGFCVLLLVAGNETTTNLIGNLILCLSEDPDALERVRADRRLVPGTIEEALRYYSPVKTTMRVTTREVTLGTQQIEAGQVVCAWLGSANRDETTFADADQFAIERDPNRHVAFGRGIHFCLGAPLARLEASIVLSTMLDRLPGPWLVPATQLPVIKSAGVLGVKHLPLIRGEETVRR
jgi:cytochrome P450